MSEIALMDYMGGELIIRNAVLYDLNESVAASKYPMQVRPDSSNDAMTDMVRKLAQCEPGTGHDNWLMGAVVAFDVRMSAKMLIEAERYHFFDVVSCNSTMHRITRFDLDSAYNTHVDKRMIAVMTELVCRYNENPTPENYLNVLYSNPAGFMYTMRITTNYRQLKTIYRQRKTHRLNEWREFCSWIETLPESELITG